MGQLKCQTDQLIVRINPTRSVATPTGGPHTSRSHKRPELKEGNQSLSHACRYNHPFENPSGSSNRDHIIISDEYD